MIFKSWLLFLLAWNYRGSGDVHAPKVLSDTENFLPASKENNDEFLSIKKILSNHNSEDFLTSGVDQENADVLYFSGILFIEGKVKDYKKALTLLEKAAMQNHADALYSLGKMHILGKGVKQDNKKAEHYLVRAADLGHEGAQYSLGVLYLKEGAQQDYKKALDLFELAESQGNIKAQHNLGSMHFHGHGIQTNYQKALHCYQKAAEQGDIVSQNELGKMYYKGQGTEPDYKKALYWLDKSKDLNDRKSQYILGGIYLHGLGVKIDYKEAFRWHKHAADQGLAEAQSEVGIAYLYGKGIKFNNKKALKYLHLAASQESAVAEYTLGILYKNGKVTEPDNKRALEYISRAAIKEVAEAQNSLGQIYQEGLIVEQNFESAFYWYNCAAVRGHPYAQRNLAWMYLDGEGIEPDTEKAMFYFSLAQQQGLLMSRYIPGSEYDQWIDEFLKPKQDLELVNPSIDQGLANYLFKLGMMYEEGQEVLSSNEIAARHYGRVAEMGNVIAQYRLGYVNFESSFSFDKDKKIFHWTKISADRGSSMDQYTLGFLYKYGIGVKKDYKKAIESYGQAARQGDKDAQYNLAWIYTKGLGISPNQEQALYWFNIALNQDNVKNIVGPSISIKTLLDYQRTAEAENQENVVIISVEQFLFSFGRKLREEYQGLDILETLDPKKLINLHDDFITVHLNDPDLMDRIKIKAHLEEREWLGEIKVYDPEHVLMEGSTFSPSKHSQGKRFKPTSDIEVYRAGGGTRNVGIYQYKDVKICFKQNPEIPGFDLLAYNVFKNLFPKIALEDFPIPKSDVILMNGQPFFVSKFIKGESFSSVLKNIDEESKYSSLYSFNLAKFQRLAIFHLLSVPEDCHPRNCLIREIEKTHEHEIILVDNERSFGKPISREKEGFCTRTHSVLFCFHKQLSKPIEEEVYEEIINGGLNIANLLSLVIAKDTYLSALEELAIEKGKTLLRIPTDRDALTEMGLRFNDLRRWVYLDKYRSLADIFGEVSPEIASIYGFRREKSTSTQTELMDISRCVHEIDGGRMQNKTPPSANCPLINYFGSMEHDFHTVKLVEDELGADMRKNDQKLLHLERLRRDFDKENFNVGIINKTHYERTWHEQMQQIL